MQRRLRVPIIVALALFSVLAIAAAFSSAEVSFRSAERDGSRVAEVLIGDRIVIVLRTTAAGYTPLERAEIIANRLRASMPEDVNAEDVQVASIESGQGLYVSDQLIVAIYEPEADAHKATPRALAELWRDNVLAALGYEAASPTGAEPAAPAAAEGEEAEEGAEAEPATEAMPSESPEATTESKEFDWTGTAQKWVPIFSVERAGLRLGMAQVAGPPVQVDQVKGVYQLRLDFKSIGRVYAYVPVSTISTKIDRVQGVSVWALADIEVLGF